MNKRNTVYSILAEPECGDTASRLRREIARLAVANPNFCRHYDGYLAESVDGDGEIHHPEEEYGRPSRFKYDGPVFIVSPDTPLETIYPVLQSQARVLKCETGDVSHEDLIAAAVGAECWMAAVERNDLCVAAIQGPDSIGSSAAVLARVTGNGVDVLPLDPQWPTLIFPMNKFLTALGRCREWAENLAGVDAWPGIAAKVATDLGWRASGGTKSHEASLLLGALLRDRA
jgi:hypothetical protein